MSFTYFDQISQVGEVVVDLLQLVVVVVVVVLVFGERYELVESVDEKLLGDEIAIYKKKECF
jgi:hypothetical protein